MYSGDIKLYENVTLWLTVTEIPGIGSSHDV